MSDTPVSLIDRLTTKPTSADWQQWFDIYDQLIRGWLIRFGLQASDADDVVQEILQYVVRKLPEFRHEGRAGAFRGWLRAIMRNRVKELWAARRRLASVPLSAELDQLEDPDSPLSRLWDQEHDEHVKRRLLEMVKQQVGPTAWQAFELQTLEGLAPDEVARRLGLAYATVISHKSRVLKRLRDESKGWLD